MNQHLQTGLNHMAQFLIHVLEPEKEVCKMCCCSVFIVLQLWAETRKVYSNPVTSVICALLQAGELNWPSGFRKNSERRKSKQTQRHHRQLHTEQGLSSDTEVTAPLRAQALPPVTAPGLARRGEWTTRSTRRILRCQCNLAIAHSSGITAARWCSGAPILTGMQDN